MNYEIVLRLENLDLTPEQVKGAVEEAAKAANAATGMQVKGTVISVRELESA